MGDTTTHLRLECGPTAVLPGRLENARHGLFKLDVCVSDWAYASEAYPQLRLIPNTTPNGYLWRLLVAGNPNPDEQLWCRTYVNAEDGHCDGMLAKPGRVAVQQWYVG